MAGHLIDRAGMPHVMALLGPDDFAPVAIEEWMGASPIYSKRLQQALQFEGDSVETIFKGMQFDIGAPPQFLDFRYQLHDRDHGEFWLDHCGALADVEPMGENIVFTMCHDIEDPTFDATAAASNPRAQVRPVHRPPRVNAENPAGGRFLPSPGPINKMAVPQGFGVRWDGGYEAGDEVSQYYDNLVGKLVVWGRDRDVAIARMLRALREMEIEGIATTIPADVAILSHPDFVEAKHSTKWVEDTLDLSEVTAGAGASDASAGDDEPKVRRDVDVEVNGRRYSVAVWVPDMPVAAVAGGAGGAPAATRPRRSAAAASASVAGSGKVAVPMQGTIVKVLVSVGDTVEAGQPVCVLEAMKMENNIAADKSGTVAEVKVSPGQSVGTGDIVIVID
jgi:acetyl/propionyl-CoA carboxylase alpha subunit